MKVKEISRDYKTLLFTVSDHIEKEIHAYQHLLFLWVSACRCNVIGSLGPACSKLGGFCECKPNVIGRCCDSCAPLTFGLGPEGCKSRSNAQT